MLLLSSNIHFIPIIVFLISDWSFITFSNSLKILSEFLYSTLQFVEHPYDYFLEFFIKQITYLHLIREFICFFIVSLENMLLTLHFV